MYKTFDQLLMSLGNRRPSENTPNGPVFFFDEHRVYLVPGEMEEVHWMDIHIELPRFGINTLHDAKKVLQANREMGTATPIPTWFGLNEQGNCLVFINRLDWRYIDAQALEEHVLRCIEQMSLSLLTEGM